MRRSQVLFLDTRQLPLEREAQIVAARSLGLGVIIAGPDPAPYLDWPVDDLFDVPLHPSVTAEALILDRVAARHLTPAAVVAWSDAAVELAARLGARLGLPSLSHAAATNVSNKILTRRCLERVPEANPRFAVVRTESQFLEALGAIGIPSVLRSANGGDRGLLLPVRDSRTALATFRRLREQGARQHHRLAAAPTDEALLEEALVGSVHSVAGIVHESRSYVLAVGDKRMDKVFPFARESVVPSRLPRGLQQAVIELARAAVAAVGIDHCAFYVDVRLTRQGPRIFEVGARFDGECIASHLIPRAMSTISPYEVLLQSLLGHLPLTRDDYSGNATTRAAFRRLLAPWAGRITRLEGFEVVAAHPKVHRLYRLRNVGDLVPDPEDPYDAFSVAYVIAACDLDDDIDRVLDDITARTSIGVAPDGGHRDP
jgi:L-amino acid ligase C-terminal domain 2